MRARTGGCVQRAERCAAQIEARAKGVMPSESRDESATRTSALVRRHAGSAAFAAARMLFFGFAYLAKPDGTDLFARAWLVLYYTLRLGGIAMAAIAVWLWTGNRSALAADAAVAAAVGVLLILTGLGMLAAGGDSLQMIINVVCGWMFFSSGLRNGREYLALRALSGQETGSTPQAHVPSPGEVCSLDQPTAEGDDRGRAPATVMPSPAARLRGQTKNEVVAATSPENGQAGSEAAADETQAAANETQAGAEETQKPATPEPPPPEGYLASFARKPPGGQND